MIRRLLSRLKVWDSSTKTDQSLDNKIEGGVAALNRRISQLEVTVDSARAESADEVLQSIAQGVCYGALQSHLLESGQNVSNADLTKAVDLVVNSLSNIGCSLIGIPGQLVPFDPSLHSNSQRRITFGEEVRISVPGLVSPSNTVIRKAIVLRLS